MYGELNAARTPGLLRYGAGTINSRGQTALGLFVLVAGLALPAAAGAGELWLVSTRCVCPTESADLDSLDVWRLDADNCWVQATVQDFLATTDPAVPITVFLHGNRADSERAVGMGWPVYNCLLNHAAERPFRVVIWSWPSDRIRGVRRDAQVKLCRSEGEAHLLAMFLNRLRADARLNLFGYSFGARIAIGALELLAGGQVSGRSLPDRNPAARTPMRAVLVATADDADGLAPSECGGLALAGLERALVTVNPCDRALRFYPRISGGVSAMGYSGPYCPASQADCEKIESACVGAWVGRSHDWNAYFASPDVQARLPWYAFLADSLSDASLATNP